MSLPVQTLTGIVLSLVFCVLTTSAQLVAPGGVTTYTGRGSQRRSYGTVRDPAAGFFIAGSSLEELNGVYVRTHPQVDTKCVCVHTQKRSAGCLFFFCFRS